MSPVAVGLISPVVAIVISAWLTWRFSRSPNLFSRMVDLPNERSLHTGALPRTGGVAICTALMASAILTLTAFSLPAPWAWIGGSLLLVGGISFLDDLGEVRARYRLAAHLGAGILLPAGGISWSGIELPGIYRELPHVLSWLLTLGYVVWMINRVVPLDNFMIYKDIIRLDRPD